MAKYPAAFINVIAEEGTKQEAVNWLQHTWDDYMDLKRRVDHAYALATDDETDILNKLLVLPT